MAYYQYEAIREQARGQWHGIYLTLAPQLQEALEKAPRHVPCPVHGGRDGFRFFKDYEENGGAVCNTCGPFPSGFRVLQWLMDWDFPKTLGAVNELLGVDGRIPVTYPDWKNNEGNNTFSQYEVDERIRQRLLQTWLEAVSLQDKWARPARLYLMRRGISVETINSINCRCHPNLAYFEEGRGLVGRFPALLAMLSDQHNRPITIHRTYLTDEGFKARLANPKKTMPHASDQTLVGAVVRLGPEQNILGLAEGIETALAVQEATGMTCWAATSACLLEAANLPLRVKNVVIWADNDRSQAGQTAAQKLAIRLKEEGRRVKINLPKRYTDKKSVDWNDVLQQEGHRSFLASGL